jgi:creatinine amidohydrolase
MLRKLNSLPWPALDALDRAKAIYLLPISATEQHGPHLPLGTDDLILEAALDELEGMEIPGEYLRLPALHYGNSHEHLGYAGTLSLGCSTVARIVEDVLKCMWRHGFKRLMIVNSHGGNTALLLAYAQEWEAEYGVGIHNVNFWASDFFAGAQGMVETALACDIHAGELETSLIKHIAPWLAQADAAPGADNYTGLDGYHPGWLTHQLSPGNGALGGASRATAQKGELLFRYLCEKLASALNAVSGG